MCSCSMLKPEQTLLVDSIGILTIHDGPSLAPGEIIAPSVGNDAADANFHNNYQDPDAFLRAGAPGFKIVYDPNGDIASQYNFRDMPTSVLIGRDGKVRFTHDGFFPAKEGAYAADIVALLNQKAP